MNPPQSVFSDHWYRVATLHPRLRGHVVHERHCYRGEVWHVLKDPVGRRQHRLNASAWRIAGRLDGRLSMQQIWACVVEEAGDEAPTQPEILALLARLHEAELIQTESMPDVGQLFDRADRRRRQERRRRGNPLSMRVGLVDPTPVLEALAPLAALFLRRWAAWAWLALVALALALLAPHWRALLAYAHQHLATPRMLLMLWVAYPLIKAVHEFAHALAVRVWGGEVHEMGVGLLVLMPVPYVDASAAAGFRERHRRVLVSLMGILAETTLAALAALLWLASADGLLREAAFATMLIGGASTLLFNGNPLLRFDAYYALADAIESPGLAPRSAAYWRYLARRHLMGAREPLPPAVGRGERRWLLGYGLASGLYRVFVSVAIVGWLLGWHVLLGVLAAVWLLGIGVAWPVTRLLRYVAGAAEMAGRRWRGAAVALACVGAPVAALFVMPFPDATRAAGIVQAPERAQVRSQGEGFVTRVLVLNGQQVEAGDVILQLDDPGLHAELAGVQARLRGLDVAYHDALFHLPAQAGGIAQEIRSAQAEQARLQAQLDDLSVRSQVSGRVALPQAQDLPGRWLPRGSLVAHVLAPQQARVRVVVRQDDVARVQREAGPIEVRLAAAPANTLAARLLAHTPAASWRLPSAALGDRAGGPFLTDPTDPDGLRTLEPVFTFDLLVAQQPLERIGARAWVRFDHGARPLAAQWLHRLRQLFIGPVGGGAPVLAARRPAEG